MWTSLFTCSFRHLSLYNPVHFTLTALAIWSSCISRVQLPRISASCRVGQHRFGQFWKFVLLHFYHWAAMIILLRCYSVDSTPPWKSDSQDVDSQKDFSLIMAGDLSQSLHLLQNKNDVVLSDQKYIFLFCFFF